MASLGSYLDLGLIVEERLDTLGNAMDRFRGQMNNQDQMLQSTIQDGEKSWDILNEDIRKLRADMSAPARNLEEFKESVHTSFKDVANTQGDFENRIAALEVAVNKLLAKLDK